MSWKNVALLLCCVLACSPVQNGQDGGGGSNSNFAGGGTAGAGSTPHFLGEPCETSLLQEMADACRMQPVDFFEGDQCLQARWADGGRLSDSERTALLWQGSDVNCSVFGARRLRCLSAVYPRCRDVLADAGLFGGPLADQLVQEALEQCDEALGRRFDPQRSLGCQDEHAACARGCDRAVAETCGGCRFDCGIRYTWCMRNSLILPDAGYPDAG